jgi:hypothetical protein
MHASTFRITPQAYKPEPARILKKGRWSKAPAGPPIDIRRRVLNIQQYVSTMMGGAKVYLISSLTKAKVLDRDERVKVRPAPMTCDV